MAQTALNIVILAAGKGTRMYSKMPKVLHRIGGLPMVVKSMFIFFTQFLGRVHFREQCIFSFH